MTHQLLPKPTRLGALLALLLALCSAGASGQQIVNAFTDNSPGDIAVLYHGQKMRLNWNVDQVSNAVTHTFADGHTEWLFPTFYFIEFRRGNKQLGNDVPVAKEPSLKEDWEWLLDRFFAPDEALSALDQAIELHKSRLGPPPFKHRVIITLPVPVNGQGYWGTIGKKRIDFGSDKNKLAAIEWFINEVETRFAQKRFRNIELLGYAWLDEHAKYCESYLSRVGDMAHSRSRQFFWVPYSRGKGRWNWKDYNIDHAYLQVGYFWNLKQSDQNVAKQIELARKYGMGMEFEINEKITSGKHDVYWPRMKFLIDEYERLGVFNSSGIVYYFSNSALVDLKKSTRSDDIAIMDRLARLIVDRNRRRAGLSPAAQKSQSQTYPPAQPAQQAKKSGLDWRDPEYWHF